MTTEPLHLLIAEDEAAHVEAIQRAFDQAGARVDIHSVGTLCEYRDYIAAHPPDFALVDFNLPDGHATEVLLHPPINAPCPMLVMTAFGNEQIVTEVMKAGALDYVVKSSEAFAAMPQTVERALREWKLLQKKKLAEDAICESAEEFRAMFEVASIGMAQADVQTGQFLRVNHKMCSITGYSADEMLKMRVPDVTHPEDRQKDWESFQQVVRGEAPDSPFLRSVMSQTVVTMLWRRLDPGSLMKNIRCQVGSAAPVLKFLKMVSPSQ